MAGNSVFPNKNDFSAGEISARLRLRHDTDIFKRGVRHATNMIPDPMGAIKRRGGTKLVREFETSGKRLPLEVDYYENIVPRLGEVKDKPGGILVDRDEGGPGEILYDNRDHALYFLEKPAFAATLVARLTQLRDTNYVAMFQHEDFIYLVTKDGSITFLDLNGLAHTTIVAPPAPAMRVEELTATAVASNSSVSFDLISDLGATNAKVEYEIKATSSDWDAYSISGFSGEQRITRTLDSEGKGPFIDVRVRHFNEWAASEWRYYQTRNPLVIYPAPTIEIQQNLLSHIIFDWNLVFGAGTYEFRWREDSGQWSEWCPAYVSNARGVAEVFPSADRGTVDVQVRAGFHGIFSSAVGERRARSVVAATLDTFRPIVGLQDQEGNIFIRWDVVQDDSGEDTYFYRVRWGLSAGSVGPWCYTDQPGFLIDDLAEGLEYDINVQARTRNSAWSDPAAPIPVITPLMGDAPSVANLTAIPGDSQIEVSWPEIEDNGQVLTSLLLQYRLLGQVNYIDVLLSTIVTSHNLSGLINGRAYQIRLRAANAIGASVSPEVSVTPFRSEAPIVPQPTVSPGEESLFVTWDAIDDGGQDLEEVGVQYRRTGTDNWTTQTAGLTDSSATITSLIAGASYDVRICAGNSVGLAYSQVVRGVPAARKTAPVMPMLDAVGGIEKINVMWAAVADGGDPLTGLVLQYRVDGTNTWRSVNLALTARSSEITSLAGVTAYEIRLCGTNTIGTSYSEVVTTTTLATPVAPIMPTVTVRDGTESLDVSWGAVGDGGDPLTALVLQYKPATENEWISITLATTARTRTIGSLAAGTTFDVRLCGTNPRGTSYSATVQGTPVQAATAPIMPAISVTPGGEELAVSWPLVGTGGSPITGLVVQYRLASANSMGNAREWIGAPQQLTARNYTITGLTAEADYHVRLCGTNLVGTSYSGVVTAAPETSATKPIAPSFNLSIGDEALTALWGEIDDGGSPLTRLQIQFRENRTPRPNWGVTDLALDARRYRFADLDSAKTYQSRLCLRNVLGLTYTDIDNESPDSSDTKPIVPAITVTPGRERASVSWGVIDNGGSPLTSLQLQWKQKTASNWNGVELSTNDRSEVLTALAANVLYQFRLCASNRIGTSYSGIEEATPEADINAPTVPTPTLTPIPANSVIRAEWGAPTLNGAPIESQQLQYRVSGVSAWNTVALGVAQRAYSLTRLTRNSTYEVRICATNSAGTGYSAVASTLLEGEQLVERAVLTTGSGNRDSIGQNIVGKINRFTFSRGSGSRSFYRYSAGSYVTSIDDSTVSVQMLGSGRGSSSRWDGTIVLFMPRYTSNSDSVFKRMVLTFGSSTLDLLRADAEFTSTWRPSGHNVPGGAYTRWLWRARDPRDLLFPSQSGGSRDIDVEFFRE